MSTSFSLTELLYAIQQWKRHNPKGENETAENYEARLCEAFYELGERHGELRSVIQR
jgi:hypothetical protein